MFNVNFNATQVTFVDLFTVEKNNKNFSNEKQRIC